MSSSRTGHGAWSRPLTQTKRAERATRPSSSVDSATSRYEPDVGGANSNEASPASSVVTSRTWISVSTGS